MNPGISNLLDLIFGVIATLLVLEMTGASWVDTPGHRHPDGHLRVRWPYLPDAFAHRGFGTEYILEPSTCPLPHLGKRHGVSATIMAGFLIFGSLLYYTGGGETFVDLAKAIAGRSYGGPAK